MRVTKKVKDLDPAEQEQICQTRRENNKTEKPYNACVDCPLRWVNHCMLCVGIITNSLYSRMFKAIGGRKVEVGEGGGL